MSAEQGQGNRFEHAVVYLSGRFPLMNGVVLPANSFYDVPAVYTNDGIPVSIKSSVLRNGAPTIFLADAVRFFQATTQDALRLVAGFYESTPARAVFHSVMEVVLTPASSDALWGAVTQEEIAAFAAFIKQRKAEVGDEESDIAQLQKEAMAYKQAMDARGGVIVLNPKVARNVGRLQCSVDAERLWSLATNQGLVVAMHTQDSGGYGGLPLPFALEAGARLQKLTNDGPLF